MKKLTATMAWAIILSIALSLGAWMNEVANEADYPEQDDVELTNEADYPEGDNADINS